jgi:acetolactate synthase I/III small subunit
MDSTALTELATHTLSVYVANKPGVLARVAQVFARRGFNIDSLVVSSSMDGKFSRMTITSIGDASGLDQIIQALKKLIDVVHCVDHTGEDVVVKELALVKVAIGPESRGEVLQVADHFGGKTVDLTETSLIVMVTGNTDKLDAFIRLMKKFRVVELVRTGKVLMARGEGET